MKKLQSRSASRPFPLARSTLLKHCPKRSNVAILPGPVQFCLDIIGKLSGLSRSFAVILLETGCRPVEALALRSGNSHSNCSILITSAKNSQDRIAYSPTFRTLMPRENVDPSFQPFRHYTYRKFYRAVMATGMILPGQSGVHVPVGRLFRQAYASIANDLSAGDIDVVAHTLGHKNSRNASYYLRQKG